MSFERGSVVRDRGSMLVLVVFVGLAACTMVLTAIVPVLDDLADRQRAASAADAAALAGVTGGFESSVSLASANGATLVSWSQEGRRVTVSGSRRRPAGDGARHRRAMSDAYTRFDEQPRARLDRRRVGDVRASIRRVTNGEGVSTTIASR